MPTPNFTAAQRNTLVEMLCACPAMADASTREAVIAQLPEQVRHSITRHPATKVDVMNIVRRCLDYADGPAALLQAVAFFEGDSLPMQAVHAWLQAEQSTPPHPHPAAVPDVDPTALRQELARMRDHLRLIQERMGQFVLSTEVPLQLVKEERRYQEAIRELEQRLAAAQPPTPLTPSNPPAPNPPAPNPFGRRGRIDDPAEFFDREDLLRQIFAELGKGSSLALVGPREIGKSSLLGMVARQGPARLELPADAFIEINMQLIRNDEQFFRILCHRLGIAPCYGMDLYLAVEGRHIIICLDEIEKMRSDGFSRDAQDELRGLADGASAPFTLLIAGGTPLEQLFADTPGLTSPLTNICTPLSVAPFPPAVARQFLLTRLQPTGVVFSTAEVDDLLQRSGGHPARLQEFAAALYRAKTSGGA